MEDIDDINIDESFIHECSNNKQVKRIIRKHFKRLGQKSITKLIELLIKGEIDIRCSQFSSKSLIFHNKAKFDKDEEHPENSTLKLEFVKELKYDLTKIVNEVGKEIKRLEEEKDAEEKFDTINIDGKECYLIDKFTTYKKIRKLICDEGGDAMLCYNFDNPDLKLKPIKDDTSMQRCNIQIVSTPLMFDYPLEYSYHCSKCGQDAMRKVYDVASTQCKHICEGREQYQLSTGEIRERQCKLQLYPDIQMTDTVAAYHYIANIEDKEGKKLTTDIVSFKRYNPGYYECVLYKIGSPKKLPSYHVVDIKDIEVNDFVVPPQVKEENYLFTLQKSFDKFIQQQTNMNLYGLFPIKIALIIQAIAGSIKKYPLNFNVQIVGDASTGKTTVLKYYGFLLNNSLNLTSNGLSISIPALRGTRQTVSLFGNETKVITHGYLGSFKTIHIDEAGENKELVKNLKTFLAESNYSYDKAGSTGITNIRTAHINLSENLDFAHIGQYRGGIKKAYKENTVSLGGEEQPEWDDSWDLHLPIFRYTNPYIKKIIKEKREELMQKKVFWIDGYDYALHERFPFYYYLANEKQNEELQNIINKNIRGSLIGENIQLINALKTSDINNLFLKMGEYFEGDDDSIMKGFDKATEIFKQYGMRVDARMRSLYLQILQISRMANFRKTFEEVDFDLLKWIIEKTNCKIDVVHTTSYEIEGPPDLEKEKLEQTEIEDQSMVETEFKLPANEF